MQLQQLSSTQAPTPQRRLAQKQQPALAEDGFKPSEPPPEKGRTSWFHRTTGAIAGTAILATAGVALLGPLGNGMGGEGLIYPLAGMLVGGAVGLVSGIAAAGAAHSSEQKTSLYHRLTAAVSGAILGGVAGAALIGPMGNGMGGEGLKFVAEGLMLGSAVGTAGGALLAGHFPDRASG